MDMKLDLNKVDKVILISIFGISVLIISSVLSALVGTLIFEENIQLEVLYASMALVTLLMLPFCIILQIITFIIKIFSKDKVKKDWIIIFVNFVSIIILCAILFVFFVFMTNPLL